jgi:hypothetical protein
VPRPPFLPPPPPPPPSPPRYNLFKDDNEGYAKLVTLLGSTPLGPDTFPALVAEMKALIGTFELDPNRVRPGFGCTGCGCGW